MIQPLAASPNQSLKLEIERSLDKGLQWIIEEQNNTYGYWEALISRATALVLRATLGHPSGKRDSKI